uniref:Uncharacterized protein n=1 Tax=Myoviridae sp. ct9Uc11 TaxID=2825042 RepID=A0A8S5U9A0_9CAUD|nr:MAG TPA: hypothetical protein [Myoviridae sp. ct9Uc11]
MSRFVPLQTPPVLTYNHHRGSVPVGALPFPMPGCKFRARIRRRLNLICACRSGRYCGVRGLTLRRLSLPLARSPAARPLRRACLLRVLPGAGGGAGGLRRGRRPNLK